MLHAPEKFSPQYYNICFVVELCNIVRTRPSSSTRRSHVANTHSAEEGLVVVGGGFMGCSHLFPYSSSLYLLVGNINKLRVISTPGGTHLYVS